jgi:hypothetical protein
MRAQDIVNRGVQETKSKDQTFSYSGRPDFKEENPQILKVEPRAPISRPRTKASQNNSYT